MTAAGVCAANPRRDSLPPARGSAVSRGLRRNPHPRAARQPRSREHRERRRSDNSCDDRPRNAGTVGPKLPRGLDVGRELRVQSNERSRTHLEDVVLWVVAKKRFLGPRVRERGIDANSDVRIGRRPVDPIRQATQPRSRSGGRTADSVVGDLENEDLFVPKGGQADLACVRVLGSVRERFARNEVGGRLPRLHPESGQGTRRFRHEDGGRRRQGDCSNCRNRDERSDRHGRRLRHFRDPPSTRHQADGLRPRRCDPDRRDGDSRRAAPREHEAPGRLALVSAALARLASEAKARAIRRAGLRGGVVDFSKIAPGPVSSTAGGDPLWHSNERRHSTPASSLPVFE
jgi:hypothetical protein